MYKNSKEGRSEEQPMTDKTSVTRRRPGRPPRVSREEIVRAARRIVDDEGLARLTMRRLADEVGTTPMALYHHVGDKDALLLLLLEDAAATILRRPRLPADPRQRIVAIFRTLHDGLSSCPWIVEVLVSDDLMSEAALWYVEQVIDAAESAGLSPRRAVHVYRTLWYYTVGEIIVRTTAARRRAGDADPTYRDEVFAHLDADRYPRLAAVAGDWADLTARDSYRAGLAALVDGLLPRE
jgi:AcrR family transcriptional regulator